MPGMVVAGPELKRGDSGEAVADLRKRFRAYGYGLGAESVFDEETAAVMLPSSAISARRSSTTSPTSRRSLPSKSSAALG